jgi:Stigma-specific protein, Stig1
MARETRESSLDELAKGLASGTVSRGKALRWMGAALIGGALAAVPGVAWAAPAEAKPVDQGNCPTARVKCRGRCVNLQSDANNCGQCSNVCSAAEVCAGGACVPTGTARMRHGAVRMPAGNRLLTGHGGMRPHLPGPPTRRGMRPGGVRVSARGILFC